MDFASLTMALLAAARIGLLQSTIVRQAGAFVSLQGAGMVGCGRAQSATSTETESLW